MIIKELQQLSAVERLDLYVQFLKNKSTFSDEELEILETFFDEDG